MAHRPLLRRPHLAPDRQNQSRSRLALQHPSLPSVQAQASSPGVISAPVSPSLVNSPPPYSEFAPQRSPTPPPSYEDSVKPNRGCFQRILNWLSPNPSREHSYRTTNTSIIL